MTEVYEQPAAMTANEAVNILTLIRANRVWTSTLRVPRLRSGRREMEGDPLLIRFGYKNWRGDEHVYIVLVESIEFGRYDSEDKPRWNLHADVGERSGERKPQHRRTFLIDNIYDLMIVDENGEPFTAPVEEEAQAS
jgi:hypothetical protein